MFFIIGTQGFLDGCNCSIDKPFIECIEYESCGCVTTDIIGMRYSMQNSSMQSGLQ